MENSNFRIYGNQNAPYTFCLDCFKRYDSSEGMKSHIKHNKTKRHLKAIDSNKLS